MNPHHYSSPAAPAAGVFSIKGPELGPLPPEILIGLVTGRCYTRADIVAPGHFSSTTSCLCTTQAAMA